MKKNLLLLLPLVAFGTQLSAMEQSPDEASFSAMEQNNPEEQKPVKKLQQQTTDKLEAVLKTIKEQQATSKYNELKKYGSLVLGLVFSGIAKTKYDDQLYHESLAQRWGESSTGHKFLSNAKRSRNWAIVSGFAAGFFFYNALSGFIGKKNRKQ